MFGCFAQASNAEKASESAYLQSKTMLPGAPMHLEITQLGIPHTAKADKETKFIQQVLHIGEALDVPVSVLRLAAKNSEKHYYISMKALVEKLLLDYPQKLLGGHTVATIDEFHASMMHFWHSYRRFHGNHPVYQQHAEHLRFCVFIKIHSDEGTGLRKNAVMQWSWGPLFAASPSSHDRYLFYSMMNSEVYKDAHCGYEQGNAILDGVSMQLALDAQLLFNQGFFALGIGTLYFICVGAEGDLPAQARSFHVRRNFNCQPNELCPWCLATDREALPFSDYRPQAAWRATVSASRPWSAPSPMSLIPGGDHEIFLAKDLFHLAHLGAVRGFSVNLLCYLVYVGHFASRLQ